MTAPMPSSIPVPTPGELFQVLRTSDLQMSPEELAEKLGCSTEELLKIEAGTNELTPELVEALIKLLHFPLPAGLILPQPDEPLHEIMDELRKMTVSLLKGTERLRPKRQK